MAFDSFILAQNVVMSVVIGMIEPGTSGSMLLFIWISFIIGYVLKIIFYFGFHPWSELMRNDMKKVLKFRKNPTEQPPKWNICDGTNWLFNCFGMTCKKCCYTSRSCCKTKRESNQSIESIENGEPQAEEIELLDRTEPRNSQGGDSEHASCLDFRCLRKAFRNTCGKGMSMSIIKFLGRKLGSRRLVRSTNQAYSSGF